MPDDDSVSRRRFLEATGGAAALTAMAGCSGDGGGDGTTNDPGTTGGGDPTTDGDGTTTAPPTTMEPQEGGTLDLINSGISTLDPIDAGDEASAWVLRQTNETLVQTPNGNITIENLLASDIEVSEDFLTYTITLEEDVTFHDGTELTAHDVVYSWERLAQSDNSARASFILGFLGVTHETDDEGNYVPDSLGVEAVDDQTFEFVIESPFHQVMHMIAYIVFAVIPEGIVGDIEGYEGQMSYEDFSTGNPVGTGPFEFEDWTQGDSASVTAYGDYHGEGPYLDGVTWHIIEEDTPRYQFSTNKNADHLVIPTSQYDPEKVTVEREEDGRTFGTYGPLDSGQASGESVNYYRTAELVTYYIAFDVSNTPRAVRQAAAYVTNQQEFAESIFKSRAPPAYALTPPGIFPGGPEAYDDFVQENYPYGIGETLIGEAQQVMEDAGYSEDEPYELTINSYNAGVFQELGRELRDRLSGAHIDVSLEPTDFPTIQQRGENGNLQCYTLGWGADYPAADNFLQLIYPPNTDIAELGPATMTYTNWSEVDSEYKQNAVDAWENQIQPNLQPTEAAQEARNEGYRQMEMANWNEVVLLNATHNYGEWMYWDGLHEEPFGPLGGTSRRMQNTTWMEEELRQRDV